MATSRHPAPPVTPRPELLPLKELSWEAFESFCCELLNLAVPGQIFVQYGKRGDTQEGIDLLGNLPEGTRWVAQCKKYDQFTLQHARSALKAMQLKAAKYLLLISDEARVTVRKLIHGTPGWELWDVKDISRQVRALPIHAGKRLLEHYFGPVWREDFLGHSSPGVLLTPDVYFARQLDRHRLFHHAWQCVGRDALLDELDKLLGPAHDAALLWGRGGIGKTKLLYEWTRRAAERSPEVQVFFIDPQRPLEADAVHELPPGPCVLVLDDARQGGQLDALLAMTRRHLGTRILLSCRPESRGALRSWLAQPDFDLRKTLEVEVTPLAKEDRLALARQGLGEPWAHLAEKLATVSADSPLITVVGARLVAEQGIDPRLLSSDKEFQRLFLERFEDIVLGKVSPKLEPVLCLRLLPLLSALAPFDLDNAFLPKTACEFLHIDEGQLREALNALTEAGALLRTDSWLRVTPDLLAEHILERACVNAGRSTGYAEKVFERFNGAASEPLMRNLSALRWRLRKSGSAPLGFLDGLWVKLKSILQAGPNRARSFVLRMVVSAADLEPQKAVECAETVLHLLHVEQAGASETDAAEVRKLAFTTLRIVQETSESLASRCLDRLWEAGQGDPRPFEGYSQTDHGVAVLAWMARYRPDTSIAQYNRILDAIERWLAETDAFDHVHSPLPILDALLKKNINLYFKDEEYFEFRSFIADAEHLRWVRRRALAIIQQCVRSRQPRFVDGATASLRQALRGPNPHAATDPVNLLPWVPEQLEIIELLEQLSEELDEPFFRYLLVQALYPALHEQIDPRVRDRALKFISSLPADDFGFRLAHALSFDFLGNPLPPRDPPGFLSPCWPNKRTLLHAVARELRERFPEPSAGARLLHERISFMDQVRGPWGDAGDLLKTLATLEPSYAQGLCESAIEQQRPQLFQSLPQALHVLWKQEPSWFKALTRRLLASGQRSQRELVASAYASAGMEFQLRRSGEVLTLDAEELDTLRELLEDEDSEIRSTSVFWLEVLEPSKDAWLCDVLARFDVGERALLASNLCRGLKALHARGGISNETLATFLDKLLPLRSCSNYSIEQFLIAAAQQSHHQAFAFVLARIQQVTADAPEGLAPFSQEHDSKLVPMLGTSDHAGSYLREVLTRLPDAPAHQRRWLALLFNALCSGCTSPVGLAFLEEQARTGDEASLEAVGMVLSHASVDWVFDQFDLARRLLERAQGREGTCYQSLSDRLLNRAVRGRGEGDWRSTVPQVEGRWERALEYLRRLRLTSAAYPFYARLCEELEDLRRVLVEGGTVRAGFEYDPTR